MTYRNVCQCKTHVIFTWYCTWYPWILFSLASTCTRKHLRTFCTFLLCTWVADKSLARPGRKQTRKHVRDARDFNNIETRAVIKFYFPLQGKALKEIHSILTEILACFLPGRAKDLSAPLYLYWLYGKIMYLRYFLPDGALVKGLTVMQHIWGSPRRKNKEITPTYLIYSSEL